MVTKFGYCIRFKESTIRPLSRNASGVIGMNIMDQDEVVGMQLDTQGDMLLIASENGLGKKTDISEFTPQNRGGKGVKCYKINDRSGNVIGVKAVDDTREIMLITTEGIIIQLKCADISKLGRITSGVKLINLDEGVTVATISKVRRDDDVDASDESEENSGQDENQN
jgi:DNA gyrase subunit A